MATNPTFVNQVLDLTNQFRAQNGLAPLKANSELNAAAQAHSQDMALNDYFSHTGKNGSAPWDRAKVVGYEARSMGENIAAGQTTPEAVVQGWINSPGHRANLLNASFKELGVGFYSLENDTGSVNYQRYWGQLFGSGDLNPNSTVVSSSPAPAAGLNLVGNSSSERLNGRSSNDTLIGGGGNDTLFGAAGDDLLRGGGGNDVLNGGAGNDRLVGGSGGDSFKFNSEAAFRSSDVGLDAIVDFVRGTDRIVLDQTTFGSIASSQIAIVNTDAGLTTSDGAIVYSRGSGSLAFNSNGSAAGFGRGGVFAVIDSDNNTATAAPALTRSDFQIVA